MIGEPEGTLAHRSKVSCGANVGDHPEIALLIIFEGDRVYSER
jgi:hypothetical protein